MNPIESSQPADAGQGPWTRDLARDLFPGPALPFSWTLLRGPVDAALRGAYAELGAGLAPSEPLWRLDAGYVYLNAPTVAAADERLCAAAWLGPIAPPAPSGLRARMQAGAVVKRSLGRLQTVPAEASGLQTRLARWLTWVQGLRWTQADILQVMEELEPHAIAAAQVYFLARAALNPADAQLSARLDEWLPALSSAARSNLVAGIDDLPSIAAARAIAAAAQLPAADPERLAALARHGHRGPGEMRPDGSRWGEAPALLEALPPAETADARLAAARTARLAATQTVGARLKGAQARQFDELLARVHEAIRTADLAWDILTMVMAAAQRWSAAAAREAMLAGLITRPEDVLFLELEELKQVATGEWHGGRSADAQALVAGRAAQPATLAGASCPAGPVTVLPGDSDGPVYADTPARTLPPSAAVWQAEALDPGCVAFWPAARALTATGCEVWAPGMIAARGLGIPARVGVRRQDASA